MKNIITKSIAIIFVLTLLLSFAACGGDKETGTSTPTTKIQTTTAEATTSARLSDELVQAALETAGISGWDGVYTSITPDQKKIIEDSFAASGKPVEVRTDGVYYKDSSVTETTSEVSTLAQTTADPNSTSTTKKPATTSGGVSVTSLTLNPTVLNLTVGGTSAITAAVLPSSAKNKTLSWKSDNEKVASVDGNGTVVGKADGVANITCTANGGTNIKATCKVTVSIAPTGAVLSYKYNEDEGFFYIENDPWQRDYGFNRLYDWGAPITAMYYNTVRVKFSYSGLDWMIQMWKGQYGYAFIGSEIGVYTKKPGQIIEHYDCASNDNSLKMQMELYQKDKWKFTRNYDVYWWITGFVPGNLTTYLDRTELTMLAIVTLKDAEMTDLFVKALEGQGFTKGFNGFSTPDTYSIEGNSVHFNWKNIAQKTTTSTITFDSNGGSEVASISGTVGAHTDEPAAPKKAGYTFMGWDPEIPLMFSRSNLSVKAKWAEGSVITFDSNGGSEVASMTSTAGATLTAPAEPTKSNRVFDGWSPALPSTFPEGGLTVEAKWK